MSFSASEGLPREGAVAMQLQREQRDPPHGPSGSPAPSERESFTTFHVACLSSVSSCKIPLLAFVFCVVASLAGNLPAAPPDAGPPQLTIDPKVTAGTNAEPHFIVQTYQIEGNATISPDSMAPLLAKYTGTNVGLAEIVQAAAALQSEYRQKGYPSMCVAISELQITNGVVTMHVYSGAFSQILVSGQPYLRNTNEATVATIPTPKMPPATNAEPRFPIDTYDVAGNTLLPTNILNAIFAKHTGTNIAFSDITLAVKELQMAYHDRGYDTVSVTIPQQRLTNATFRIRVFEGKLAEILVTGNHYYSSNNVMRALPGLKTNMFLNSKVLQPELDRANANQDRQVYPEISPGPETNTTSLFLKVKDRLPLHAKIEANNQSSPGTPEDRINFSAVYNNLWQEDHSFGVQYSFSPQDFKDGNQWEFYDRPLVANYSAFYRLPLAAPDSLADAVASRPGNFGYNEATRKFELPPASGVPELNMYASRSTIDTGVTSGDSKRLSTSISGTIDQTSDHQDLTVNQSLGFRLSEPLPELGTIRSRVQGGLDFKSYDVSSFDTNNFIFTQYLLDTSGNPFTRVSTTPSPVPSSAKSVSYLPLAVRWDANRPDKYGSTDFGLNYSPNVWHSGSESALQGISNSKQSSGYWHVVSSSLGREQIVRGDWRVALRADGQWANEPLISNEQFGVGGIGGVHGYREGEEFGDMGWRLNSELKTPTYRVGNIGNGTAYPLVVRASVFMDYAETYLIDPQGRPGMIPLWGSGFGGVASVGHIWEGRLLFSWPLLRTPTSEPGQVRVSFALNAQF